MIMTKLLITPGQVVEIAFPGSVMWPEMISEASIEAVQERMLAPVFGDMYEAMTAGRYDDFVAEYIVRPLALRVKMQIMPSLASQCGPTGITEQKSSLYGAAGDLAVRRVARQLRRESDALLLKAVERVESAPELFPEYDPRRNVLNRCDITSGAVLCGCRKGRPC